MEPLPLWFPPAIFFLTSLLAPVFSGHRGRVPASLWSLVPFLCFAVFLHHAPTVWEGTVVSLGIPWAPSLGLGIDLALTPVGLLLALLVTGIGGFVVLFAAAYLHGSDRIGRFLGLLFAFGGAMLGLAVSDNLLLLFVFWELTSVSSYLLIGHFHEKLESRKSALDALLITGTGGVALLAGVLLLGEAGGSYLLSELIANREAVVGHQFYPWILGCILLGALTKSAQFPFHFWLPGAMAAPAPVSAYLHSATMVKAGVFLLAILHPLLGNTSGWHHTLIAIGAITMLWGALVAMFQTDLKRLLAFSTVSALGTLTMLLGIENSLAAKAAMVFFLVHALYKGALFMVAGSIEKATGTREISELRGLLRTFPPLGLAAVVAAFSMSGLPPFVGFIAKELLYEVKLETPPIGHLLLVAGVLANAANIVVALKVGILPFFGPGAGGNIKSDKPKQFGFWAGPVVLGLLSLVFGLFPGSLLGGAIEAMNEQIAAEDVTIKLKLWHGFNLVFLLSLVTTALGVLLFVARHRLDRLGAALGERLGWSGTACFRWALAAFLGSAGRVTRLIQSGSLPRYLATIFFVALATLTAAWYISAYRITLPSQSELRLDAAVVGGFLIVAAISLVFSRKRMTSILLLGTVGFGIAALFALYGAPDLAITQILVETLTLLLFALAIRGLPAIPDVPEESWKRWGKTGLAVLVGACFTLLTWKAFDVQLADSVAKEIAARSVPEAYGRNVVNVILVDFRALDTLGEITVLAIAALGVAAMLGGGHSRTPISTDRSPVLAASARYTAPIMVAFSLYLLLRGHNEPGGGFIGGLVGAMGAVLLHLADPARRLRLFYLAPGTLMVTGLLTALLSGVPSLVAGGPYMEALWAGAVTLPAVGKVAIGTPLAFDVGVYLVVAGVVLLLYGAMEKHIPRQGATSLS